MDAPSALPRPSARVRALAALLWVLLIGMPLLGVGAEAALQWRWRMRVDQARAYRRSLPALFDGRPVSEAWVDSLWATRWIRYRPGARLQVERDGVAYDIAIERHGFRTREFADEKPPGTLRVACVGGSTTVQGRVNAETYPALLEQRLASLFPDWTVEVLNLGISGSRSDYWLERGDELSAWSPDVVVQYEGVNDILWRWLPRYWRHHRGQAVLRHTLLFSALWPLRPPDLDPEFDRSAQTLARMAGACRKQGIRYVAGTFAAPDPEALAPDQAAHLDLNVSEWRKQGPALRSYAEYEALLTRFNERLPGPVRAAGGTVAPVAASLRDPRLFTDLCHLRAEGIASLADAFFPDVARVLGEAARARAKP